MFVSFFYVIEKPMERVLKVMMITLPKWDAENGYGITTLYSTSNILIKMDNEITVSPTLHSLILLEWEDQYKSLAFA